MTDPWKYIDSYNIEAALLGSLLLNPDRIKEVKHLIKPEDFEEEDSGVIYQKFCDLYFSGIEVDQVTLGTEISHMDCFKQTNIPLLMMCLMSSVGCSTHAVHYARLIAKKSLSKELTRTLDDTTNKIIAGDLDEINLTELKDRLDLLKNQGITELTQTINQVLKTEDDSSVEHISTGFTGLDLALGGGIRLGDFTTIAGSPATGKSQFAINLMTKAKKEGKPARTLFVCQEMDAKSIQDRIIGSLSNIPCGAVTGIRKGTASEATMKIFSSRYIEAIESLAKLPIKIHSTGCLNIDELSTIITKNINEVDMIIIDYIQQIRKVDKRQSDYEKTGDVSRLCMETSRDYHIPVIALSQLNREGYKDEKTKPTMANLRESGQIEQDSANVWLLWRDRTEKPEAGDDGRKFPITLSLILGKNRNGETGIVNFDYKMDCGKIREQRAYY